MTVKHTPGAGVPAAKPNPVKNAVHLPTTAKHHMVGTYCELQDIKAFCEHPQAGDKKEGGPAKPGAPAPPAAKPGTPAPPPKPGAAPAKPGEAPPPGGGLRLAKEEKDAPPPAPHPVPAAHPAGAAPPAGAAHHAVAPRPAGAARPAAPPKPKPLMLHVVPKAPEGAKEPSEKSYEAHGVKAATTASHSSQGDKVTLKAIMEGACTQHPPQWTIKDTATGGKPVTHSAAQWSYTFLPLTPPRGTRYVLGKLLWLEAAHPHIYRVECQAKEMLPTAHRELQVWVYPPEEGAFEFSTDGPEMKHAEDAKKALKALVSHVAPICPGVQDVKIDFLTGTLTLKNSWEESDEAESSNLAHWKLDVDAKLEIVKIAVTLGVSVFDFLRKFKALEKTIEDGEKLASWFEKKTDLSANAGMYLTIALSAAIKGQGNFVKEEDGKFSPHFEGVHLDQGAEVSLEARLDVHYKDNELLVLSGKASSKLTLSTSPRLVAGPNLWLDNKYSWEPLSLTITAKANAALPGTENKDRKIKAPTAPTKADTDKAVVAPPEGGFSWKGDVFAAINDRPLSSINLLTGEIAPHPWGPEDKPAKVTHVPTPAVPKPAGPKVPPHPPVKQ